MLDIDMQEIAKKLDKDTEKEPKGTKFYPAEEVVPMANELIAQFHPHLLNAKISYMFRDGKWNKNDRPVVGDVKLMSPYYKTLTGLDFGIVRRTRTAIRNGRRLLRRFTNSRKLSHAMAHIARMSWSSRIRSVSSRKRTDFQDRQTCPFLWRCLSWTKNCSGRLPCRNRPKDTLLSRKPCRTIRGLSSGICTATI